jgi:hypothetical protein
MARTLGQGIQVTCPFATVVFRLPVLLDAPDGALTQVMAGETLTQRVFSCPVCHAPGGGRGVAKHGRCHAEWSNGVGAPPGMEGGLFVHHYADSSRLTSPLFPF